MNDQHEDAPRELVYVRQVRDDSYGVGDEISLIDLWLVLARRKWNVIAITVLCLALGLGYAWMKPAVYEYRTGIELATIHGGPQSGGPVLPTSREGSLALLQQFD